MSVYEQTPSAIGVYVYAEHFQPRFRKWSDEESGRMSAGRNRLAAAMLKALPDLVFEQSISHPELRNVAVQVCRSYFAVCEHFSLSLGLDESCVVVQHAEFNRTATLLKVLWCFEWTLTTATDCRTRRYASRFG